MPPDHTTSRIGSQLLMRFLIDAQPALARWLAAKGHEAEHVADRQMASASDSAIWGDADRSLLRIGSAVEGGAWPSGPDIKHFMIERIIDAYGRNGEKLWEAELTQPSSTLGRK
jgi:hypothetical protein